ncbi:MAG: PEP-CTERM sorting domain-containing protein [Rhodocyclaceae bacterium]|nr:PEP-CTERM sorting domain-containing protein [Rhodocyclaceae bacterium]MBX3670695.1 PEP-CTERM sorting domain-containing protein [Rhodocyclaceae bacterium]
MPIKHKKLIQLTRDFGAIAGVIAGLACAAPAQAGVFGSLANFDVVNDTGHEAHGFEIELEGISRNQVLDVFGLNRNFGTPSPGDVERYGLPTINDLIAPGGGVIGVRIRYQAAFNGGAWSTGTAFVSAANPFNTPGESCWSFGNVGYPNVPCDHFGVSTAGNPTRTTYQWLIDPTNTGALSAVSAAIPAVQFTPPPPAPPGNPPAPVVAQIQGVVVDPFAPVQDSAYWVKIITTSLPNEVDLNDLMGGDNPFANPGVAAMNNVGETEIEWQVLQPGKVDEVSKAINANAGDEAQVIRYEFYRYMGRFDDDGFVDPTSDQTPHGNTLTDAVGQYIGEQIAGFNVQAGPPVGAPEPGTLALLAAALGLTGFSRKRAIR